MHCSSTLFNKAFREKGKCVTERIFTQIFSELEKESHTDFVIYARMPINSFNDFLRQMIYWPHIVKKLLSYGRAFHGRLSCRLLRYLPSSLWITQSFSISNHYWSRTFQSHDSGNLWDSRYWVCEKITWKVGSVIFFNDTKYLFWEFYYIVKTTWAPFLMKI